MSSFPQPSLRFFNIWLKLNCHSVTKHAWSVYHFSPNFTSYSKFFEHLKSKVEHIHSSVIQTILFYSTMLSIPLQIAPERYTAPPRPDSRVPMLNLIASNRIEFFHRHKKTFIIGEHKKCKLCSSDRLLAFSEKYPHQFYIVLSSCLLPASLVQL